MAGLSMKFVDVVDSTFVTPTRRMGSVDCVASPFSLLLRSIRVATKSAPSVGLPLGSVERLKTMPA